MKTKNLIILSSLLIIIILGSYIIFNKQKKGIIVETTTTTKLALCSNKYLTTEYDTRDINGEIGGKIIIKDWPWDETNTYEISQENQGYGSPNPASKFLSFDYIKDLSCVQRIDLQGGTNYNLPWAEDEDIEKLASLINIEEININMTSIPKGKINNLFKYWPNLKKITIFMSGLAIESSENMEYLTKLEELQSHIYGKLFFDFNSLSKTIKSLYLVDGNVDNSEYIFQNGSNLANLTNLEEIYLPNKFILENKDKFCGWMSNWKKLRKFQCWSNCEECWNNVCGNSNIKDFDCSKWINDLYNESQVKG